MMKPTPKSRATAAARDGRPRDPSSTAAATLTRIDRLVKHNSPRDAPRGLIRHNARALAIHGCSLRTRPAATTPPSQPHAPMHRSIYRASVTAPQPRPGLRCVRRRAYRGLVGRAPAGRDGGGDKNRVCVRIPNTPTEPAWLEAVGLCVRRDVPQPHTVSRGGKRRPSGRTDPRTNGGSSIAWIFSTRLRSAAGLRPNVNVGTSRGRRSVVEGAMQVAWLRKKSGISRPPWVFIGQAAGSTAIAYERFLCQSHFPEDVGSMSLVCSRKRMVAGDVDCSRALFAAVLAALAGAQPRSAAGLVKR